MRVAPTWEGGQGEEFEEEEERVERDPSAGAH